MCGRCTSRRRRALSLLTALPLLTVSPVLHGMLMPTAHDAPSSVTSAVGWFDGAAKAAEANTPPDGGDVKYTCPMHPHYIADDMGTCPICGMDLVKLETGPDLGATGAESRTAITVSAETIQNMGVRLGSAEQSTFGRSIRSFGIVHENERKQFEMTSRVEGWIENLKVTAVGDTVTKGDMLFEVYSPQLVISQGDYMRSRGDRSVETRSESQLRSFGVQAKALAQIRKRRVPMQRVPFYAEQTGTVSELMLRQGTYLKRGMMLLKVQDYSTVWLRVGVAEKDLTFLSQNTPATVTFPNLPGRQVAAKIDYIYPTIDPKTRTGQVRLVLDNTDGSIRPGSYADVEFDVSAEKRLAIPSEAVLRSGQGQYVVASLGGGRFEPRLVETGLISDGRTEIKRGILAGEDVVVSGQFLLDSESALRESFRKLKKLQVPLSLLQLTSTELAMIDHLIDAGLYIHESIIDGYDIEPNQLDAALSIKELMWPRYRNTQLAFVLTDATKALQLAKEAKTESEMQTALAALFGHLRAWVLKGAPEHYREKKIAVFEDPASKRTWLQIGDKPLNPYARGGAERVPYPEKSTEPDKTADAPTTESAISTAMQGSHDVQ